MFPLETGGTFMGWWADDATAVIGAMIGPGPEAVHELHNFVPDQHWQLKRIARRYDDSGRLETYLGDWHSHPKAASGRISRTDRGVLRRIIQCPEARCAKPLMSIFWGTPDALRADFYHASLQHRPMIWNRLVVEQAELRIY